MGPSNPSWLTLYNNPGPYKKTGLSQSSVSDEHYRWNRASCYTVYSNTCTQQAFIQVQNTGVISCLAISRASNVMIKWGSPPNPWTTSPPKSDITSLPRIKIICSLVSIWQLWIKRAWSQCIQVGSLNLGCLCYFWLDFRELNKCVCPHVGASITARDNTVICLYYTECGILSFTAVTQFIFWDE